MSTAELIGEAMRTYAEHLAQQHHMGMSHTEISLLEAVADSEEHGALLWTAQQFARAVLDLLEEGFPLQDLARRYQDGKWVEPEDNPVEILGHALARLLWEYR